LIVLVSDSMQSQFFVPFLFDETTLPSQVLEPTHLTSKELDAMRRQLLGSILHEAHAVQLRIRDYKRGSSYDRVYATTKVDPHYEAWVEEHMRLLQTYLQTQYPALFEVLEESQENQNKERHQRVLAALQLLLARIRSDRAALEMALTFAQYDGDPFQGGLCKFL